ncbi:MAG: hypothetical protein IPK27_00170 [Rhodanobacteraceae bacterium]|nr:hypothetical protein [Rhodanobacteraceae bacterium]
MLADIAQAESPGEVAARRQALLSHDARRCHLNHHRTLPAFTKPARGPWEAQVRPR